MLLFSIMPPKRKTKGKKESVYSYAKRNPGKIALGAGALGLGGFESLRALQRYNLDRRFPRRIIKLNPNYRETSNKPYITSRNPNWRIHKKERQKLLGSLSIL